MHCGLVATLATMASPLAHSATGKETQAMPQPSDTALFILDFQVGIGENRAKYFLGIRVVRSGLWANCPHAISNSLNDAQRHCFSC